MKFDARPSYQPIQRGTRKDVQLVDGSGNPVSTRMKNWGGYGDHGASHRRSSMKDYWPMAGSPDDDIYMDLVTLRIRSRDQYICNPLATAAINTKTNNVIADGLRPQPCIDPELCGMTEQDATKMNKKLKFEFELWADDPDCDWERRLTFWQLQTLAYKTMLLSGDIPSLLAMRARPTSIYELKVRLIEPDRVETPFLWNFIPNIVEGVELDSDTSEVAYYHVRQVHPLTKLFTFAQIQKYLQWIKVPAYNEFGRPNMILAFDSDRPGQRRGIPLLSKVLQALKQMDRFMNATVAAAVYQSFWAYFVESELPSENMFAQMGPEYCDAISSLDEYEVRVREGEVAFLKPGDKIHFPEVKAPNEIFQSFVKFMSKVIGAAVQVPGSILLKEFEASYSASRAELLEFGKHIDVERALVSRQFCQVYYEQLILEAVAKGYVDAPRNFWTDPRVRKGFMACNWTGANQGSIDPEKEANAWHKLMIMGAMTGEQISRIVNGTDYMKNILQQGREYDAAKKSKIAYPPALTPTNVTQRIEDITQDNEGNMVPKPPEPATAPGSTPSPKKK